MAEKKKVPTLRFPGFTGDWEQRKLSDIAEIVGGGTPSTSNPDYWDGNIDWYAPAEIGEQIFANGSVRKITKEGLSHSSAKILPAHKTVLFTSRAGIGNMAILQQPAATNQGFQSIVCHNDVEPYFVFSMGDKIKVKAERAAAGSTFAEISGKKLGELEFMFPGTDEQSAIGTYFKGLDNLITLHQRQLDNLKKLKKGCLQKMFPRNGETKPELRFPGFTDDWEQRKYGEVIDLLSGQDFAPSQYNDEGNGIPYMTGASCINHGETIVNRWTPTPKCIAYKGDVLLVCKGSGYGALARLSQEKAHIARQFMALRCLDGLDSNFNFYLAASVVGEIKKDARGLIAGIDRNAILNQNVFLPKLDEQRKIGNYFVLLDNAISLHQCEIDELNQFKKGMLQQMFV